MSLPDGVTTCLLTYGPITDTFGNLADSITVEVVADRTIVHGASGRTMFKNPVFVTADGGGVAQLPVPHTDQAGFLDQQQNSLTGWYYTVRLTARFGNDVQTDTKSFQPVVGQVTRDADLLPSPGMVTPGVTVGGTAVTSVAGETGAVSAESLAEALGGLVGGSGLPSNVVSRTAAYTAAANDFVLATTTSAGFTVTLPTAPSTGALVAVKKVSADGNTLTITPAGGGTIDGDPTATTVTKGGGAVFEHVGANVWQIVAVTLTTGPAGPEGPRGEQGEPGEKGDPGGSGNPYAAERPVVGGTADLVVPGIAIRDVAVGVTIGPNLVVYMPAFVTDDKTLLSLNVEVTTAVASSNLRIQLYETTSAFQPGTLVVESGNLSAATIGRKTFTTSTALAPGTYLAAVTSDSAVQIRGFQSTIPNQPMNGSGFGTGANILRGLWTKARTFGPAADPGAAWDTSTDSATISIHPLVAFGF